MRLRTLALASSASALALAMPVGANAAVHHGVRHHGPRHNHGITIAATPNPIVAGQSVLIYGQLNGTAISGETVDLYHRVAPHGSYTLIGTTTTNTQGFYEFTRAEGVVTSNRSWYVRVPALPGNIHSRTVYEKVAAEVSLNASATTATTSTPIVFSGNVYPSHTGGHVALQVENAAGTAWKTVKYGRITTGSNYSISYKFGTPGDREVRVSFAGDARNTAAASDPVAVSIQQAEVADFTLTTSAQTVIYGGSGATLSGVLYNAGTTTPDGNVSVTLWSHTHGQKFHTDGLPQTTNATTGAFSFAVNPSANTVYQVRTTYAPVRKSADLWIGVHDVVSMTPSATTATVGQKITFTGTVSPDKAGHLVYLERLGTDGHWQIVKVGFVTNSSNYKFGWTFGAAGSPQFRVVVPGGPSTLGAASAPATITVTLPPVGSLPTAS